MTGGSTPLTANPFTAATSWWPTISEYSEFSNYATDANGNSNNAGIVYGGDTTDSTITFSGITAVEDSDVTADYAFGYADVTPNGSPSNLGAPVNPYANNASGGDGFDLAWAVDSNGNPVNVGKVYYVRVYTAVLDNGYFGETSTEVCGIFTTYGSNGSAATTDLTIKKSLQTVSVSNMGSKEIAAGTYSVKSSEANVYINGVKVNASSGYNLSVVAGQKYQIITQNGNEEPFITVLIGK